jgi:hypothetical protein
VLECSSKDVDTSNLSKVKKFIKKNKSVDILILNTGGPPAKDFYKIEDLSKFDFSQIQYAFVLSSDSKIKD